MSPRSFPPSGSSLREPLMSKHASAFLTFSEPKMDGAILRQG